MIVFWLTSRGYQVAAIYWAAAAGKKRIPWRDSHRPASLPSELQLTNHSPEAFLYSPGGPEARTPRILCVWGEVGGEGQRRDSSAGVAGSFFPFLTLPLRKGGALPEPGPPPHRANGALGPHRRGLPDPACHSPPAPAVRLGNVC